MLGLPEQVGPGLPQSKTHTSDEQRVAGDSLHGLQQETGEGHPFTAGVRCQLLQESWEAMRNSQN